MYKDNNLRKYIIQRIEDNYLVLNKIGSLGINKGFLRAGYSAEESEAIKHFENMMEGLGFTVRYDSVGNFSAEFPGESGKFIEMASHLDTVPQAGNFDGVVGVLTAALAFEKIIKDSTIKKFKHGLRLRIWRLEESGTYKIVYAGSKAAFGQLDPKFLDNTFNNIKLSEAIRSAGFSTRAIENNTPQILQHEIDHILAHIEVHIEQGNLLIESEKKIGVVNSIRGNRRVQVNFSGRCDHSGATPMGEKFRRDCNLALCHTVVELDKLFKKHKKNDLVQTIGDINSDPKIRENLELISKQGITKVAGASFFLYDIRSCNNQFLLDYYKKAEKVIQDTANKFNVDVQIHELSVGKAVEKLDSKLIKLISETSKELDLPHMVLSSGAGHDAGVVANQLRSDGKPIPTVMVFIPCKDGISHSPDEYSSPDEICDGVCLITSTLRNLLNINI